MTLITKIKNKSHGLLQYSLRNKNNSPFISGDSIADLAHAKINSLASFNHKNLTDARTIFIAGHLLIPFFENFGSELDNKTLISGNSDFNLTSIPPNFPSNIRLLCQNNTLKNNSILTLPIGLENMRLGRSGFKHYHRGVHDFAITNKVLIPPMNPTNLMRTKIIADGKLNRDLFDVIDRYLPKREYFKLTKRYKFIFVCEGNGFDTHRMWEVLYQNSFPVALRSDWTETLSWLNLPILLVNSLEELTFEKIAVHYEKYINYDSKATKELWIPFWRDLISSKTMSES